MTVVEIALVSFSLASIIGGMLIDFLNQATERRSQLAMAARWDLEAAVVRRRRAIQIFVRER